MSVALSSESLLELAKSRAPADRERLLLGIVELCDAGDGASAMASAQIQLLLNSIFLGLVAGAERDIRKRLADKLSTADWAPPALINVLALDEIEIARPVIAASPVLQDRDLIRLLVEATIEHQIEVARRPNLGPDVVCAILKQGEPAVMTALAGNYSATVGPGDMRGLVEAAREIAALRSPLSKHPCLTGDLALQLYILVGQALRQSLAERFRLDPRLIEEALAHSVQEAHAGVANGQGPVVLARNGEREAMEVKLIEKLYAAGQLRPGYLVRALQEGRLSLFTVALATLGRFEPDQVQGVILGWTNPGAKEATASVRFGNATLKVPVSAFAWAGKDIAKALPRGSAPLFLVKDADDDGRPVVVELDQEPDVEAALLAIESKSGEVRAMVGGYSYARSRFNRAWQAERQIGSTVKAFVYGTAFEQGMTPATLVNDVPTRFVDPVMFNVTEGPDGRLDARPARPGAKEYAPRNYERDNWGPIPISDASR